MRSNRVGPTFFAQVAQLGERQTEDLNVPGSSPGLGIYLLRKIVLSMFFLLTIVRSSEDRPIYIRKCV